VRGIAADGTSRIILRIPADISGQVLGLSVLSDPYTNSINVQRDGGLAGVDQVRYSFLGLPTTTFYSFINVTSQTVTVNGVATPMAFAVYQAPGDFARPGGVDDAAGKRSIYIGVNLGGSSYVYELLIVRPPIFLVHGLTAYPAVWDNFPPLTPGSATFAVARADYSQTVSGVLSTTPAYQPKWPWPVKANELGFDYNAPNIFKQIQDFLVDFRVGAAGATGLEVAAVQVDVVAHSMGGVLTRTMPYVVHDFYSLENYQAGVVHKLITIATPHLGSPLATDILAPNSESLCTAKSQAELDGYPFFEVNISGVGVVSGAHRDLQGDGQGGGLSPALQRLQTPSFRPLRIAYIAGTYSPYQATLAGAPGVPPCCTLDGIGQISVLACHQFSTPFQSNVLANYSAAGWPTVMGGPSDGIVPLNSALNGSTPDPSNLFTGAIHGPGTYPVGFLFLSPNMLNSLCVSYAIGQYCVTNPFGGVPTRVVALLNSPAYGSDFQDVQK
jgi:hypothetical protein